MQTLSSLEIERRPLHEEVADRLRTMITEGRLTPGARLNERVLCELLRVSRTPLREAFKVLASERLIELNPNRGASVVALSRSDVEQLFELMSALEGLSGQLAAERCSDEELAVIRSLHAEMLAARGRRDLPEYYALNRRIHQSINRCARNAMLTETYESVNTRIQNLRFRSNFNQEKWEKAVLEHQAMLDALEARDGALLRSVLETHLRNKRDAVLEQWSDIDRQQREALTSALGRSQAPDADRRSSPGEAASQVISI